MFRIGGAETRRWTVVARDKLRRITELQLPTVTQGGATGRPEIFYTYDEDGNIANQVYTFAGSSNNVTAYFGYFDELTGMMTDMGGGQAVVQARASDYEGRTIQNLGPYVVATSSAGPAYILAETGRSQPNSATFTYGPFSTLSNIVDEAGNVRVSFASDSAGLVKQVSVPNPAVPQVGTGITADTPALNVSRDNFSLLNGVTDVFGNGTTLSRDQMSRVTSVTDPAGTQVKTGYSSASDTAAASTVAGGAHLERHPRSLRRPWESDPDYWSREQWERHCSAIRSFRPPD